MTGFDPRTDVSLTDRDKELLDEYDTYEDVTERSELADYMNALARFIVVAANTQSYEVYRLLELNSTASDLRDGDISVDEAHEWLESFEVS